jgi:hypothetical protein
MPHPNLALTLRQALTRGPLDAALSATRDGLQLSGIRDVPALLAALDNERPYGEARDALLAALLRLHRASGLVAARDAALYALQGSVLRRFLRLTPARLEPHERVAEVLHALTASLDAFDPERRSPHVQAGVEQDVRHRLWRTRRDARRSHQTERAAEARVAHAAFELCAGTYAIADLIERAAARPAAEHPDSDAPGAEGLFARLVAQRALLPRDAALLLRVHVRREPIANAAAALGLRLEAARKALLRARRRLRECRPLIESLCASPPDAA